MCQHDIHCVHEQGLPDQRRRGRHGQEWRHDRYAEDAPSVHRLVQQVRRPDASSHRGDGRADDDEEYRQVDGPERKPASHFRSHQSPAERKLEVVTDMMRTVERECLLAMDSLTVDGVAVSDTGLR